MKKLNDILYKTNLIDIIGSTDIEIADVQFDSRLVNPNSLFIAIKGTKTDGHQHIEKAIESGALAIVCQNLPKEIVKSITYIKVEDSSYALGVIASNFFDNPSKKLKLIGITGTNGKTTTATLLYKLFIKLGYKVGLLSTVINKINENVIPATHTTPDALQLNALLNEMVENNCTFCFMEVSSHAIVQNRIAGVSFAGGVFTNITHDHLDFHKTFVEYIKAKKAFFDSLPSDAFALTNIDDINGNMMLQNTKATKHTYSLNSVANYRCKIIENVFSGLQMNIDGCDVWCKLVGSFNAYNLLAIYATAILLGEEKTKILTEISNLDAVEGRFEIIRSKNNLVAIVDYAHTPDALSNVLNTIKSTIKDKEQIITVFGCGGDRDAMKRPVMGGIASQLSDKIIVTSDNPRSESPEEIIKQILQGVDLLNQKKVLAIENRKEAIKTACLLAQSGDIILVAGKGHENYQEINGIKHHFDDKEILNEIFEYNFK
ncbi:MAG: UDP-N-acetylmuramoyl-L-alanyl-D-glutamate--2,6-diaminopimelate ligase [Bacteroidetes bacterium CG2_30_32_10]|nr:MAG: UDP-N-acetylmuramoyl-L-alanyl-D-glutamate--2,6-diaminopimelate ligase [Bacteroidetes bacterium CG2_30_32_10]